MKRNEDDDDDRDRLLSQLVTRTHSFLHLVRDGYGTSSILICRRGRNGTATKIPFLPKKKEENTSDGWHGSSFRPFCRSRGTLSSLPAPSLHSQHATRTPFRRPTQPKDSDKNRGKKIDVVWTPSPIHAWKRAVAKNGAIERG